MMKKTSILCSRQSAKAYKYRKAGYDMYSAFFFEKFHLKYVENECLKF
jgi:hypothetical protein